MVEFFDLLLTFLIVVILVLASQYSITSRILRLLSSCVLKYNWHEQKLISPDKILQNKISKDLTWKSNLFF